MAAQIYRLLELLDGEKGKRFIPYKIAQKLKIWVLGYIKDDYYFEGAEKRFQEAIKQYRQNQGDIGIIPIYNDF